MPKQTKEEFLKKWKKDFATVADLLDAEQCNCGMCDGEWILKLKKEKKKEGEGK